MNLLSNKRFLPLGLFSSITIGLSMLYFGVLHTIIQTSIIITVVLLNLWFIYLLIIPREYGKLKYRRITVSIAVLAFGIFIFLNKSENSFIIKEIKKVVPVSITPFFQLSSS